MLILGHSLISFQRVNPAAPLTYGCSRQPLEAAHVAPQQARGLERSQRRLLACFPLKSGDEGGGGCNN